MAWNIYVTGFVVPANIMRRYLESHGNVFDDPMRPPTPSSSEEGVQEEEQEDDEDQGEPESEETARLRREDKLFHRYVSCFRRMRRDAPPELRTRLEIPSTLKVVTHPGAPWRKRLFIQAGAFRKHQRGHRNMPNAQDELAIATFIHASNRLLPDDDTRAEVGFRREDMEFRVVPSNAVWTGGYMGNEHEEILQMRKSIREQTQQSL
ncbi:hypothetical protein C8Q74DRAFT_1374010 [Fomes fomentarius]|nr:hypothetical protein C8Q74DRAFT_1374010 [Fomes fomentarius]